MKATLKFVTLPSPDTPGCTLILTFDDKRYIFGHIGEGTQRAIVERKFSLKHISTLYLTGRCEWRTIGGIVGQALTLIDQEHARNETEREENLRKELGVKKGDKVGMKKGGSGFQGQKQRRELYFRGPGNLPKMMATTRFFVFRTAMPVNVEEAKEGREWANDHMVVKALKTEPSSTRHANDDLPVLRKRSYDEFNAAQKADTNEAVIQSVVKGIFGSTWTMDTSMDEIRDIPQGDENLPSEDEEIFKAAKIAHVEGRSREGKTSKGKDRAPWPASVMQRLPITEPCEASVSYLVRMREQRGKFLPQKAKELGVKPGPDFSRLTKGETITTAAGVTVTPEQVMGPTRPGGGFAVLDIPEESYIENTLAKLQDEDALKGMNLVVWVLGKGLAEHPLVEAFMKKNSNIEHIVAPDMDTNTSISFGRFAGAQTRLGLIAQDTFPLSLHDERLPKVAEDKPYKLANLDQNFDFSPEWNAFEQNDIPVFDQQLEIDKAQQAYKDLAKQAQEATVALEDPHPLEDIVGKDTEIITLGTGSSLPSLYRNVSATLVIRPNKASMLLDAGENTMGQLRRLFNPAELTDLLKGLKCIYISHLHADHHLGTAGVLKSWYQAVHSSTPSTAPLIHPTIYRSRSITPPPSDPANTLYVVAPARFRTWLQEYAECEDIGLSHISFLSLETIEQCSTPYGTSDYPLPDQLATDLGMTHMRTCFARHCQSSFCSMASFSDGFKLAYSGDTRPIPSFAALAKGATVLLHEATFDDELMKEAVAKRHSTTSEALGMGEAMGARYTLLTHFSQRYPKVPELGERFRVGGAREVEVVEEAVQAAERCPGEVLDAAIEGNETAMEDATETGAEAATETTTTAETIQPAQPEDPQPPAPAPPKEWTAQEEKTPMGVAIAFDLMRIKVGQLRRFANWWDALKEVFKEEEEVVEAEAVAEEVDGKGGKQKEGKKDAKTPGEGGDSRKEAKEANKRKMKEEAKRRKMERRSRGDLKEGEKKSGDVKGEVKGEGEKGEGEKVDGKEVVKEGEKVEEVKKAEEVKEEVKKVEEVKDEVKEEVKTETEKTEEVKQEVKEQGEVNVVEVNESEPKPEVEEKKE